MSFDEKFRTAYRASVNEREAPPDLDERLRGIVASASSAPDTSAPRGARAPKARRGNRPRICGRAATAVACAAAALALVAIAPLANAALTASPSASVSAETSYNSAAGSDTGETAVYECAADIGESAIGALVGEGSGFTVRAWAADDQAPSNVVPDWVDPTTDDWGEPLIDGDDNPLALFFESGASGSGMDTLWFEEDGGLTAAEFLPETFTIEGDDIERIQIHISNGELYRQLIDKDVKGDRSIGLEGLYTWDRGTRPGYEDCDALSDYEWMEQDEEGHWWTHQDAFRLKRMGKVIDLSKSDDERVGTRDIQFGPIALATTPASRVPALPPKGASIQDVIDKPQDDGEPAVYTITVTFGDGRCKTQVIEMREGWIATDEEGKRLEPVRIQDTQPFSGGEPIAYGVVTEENDGPFPYADEPANVYADEVMPPTPPGFDPYIVGE